MAVWGHPAPMVPPWGLNMLDSRPRFRRAGLTLGMIQIRNRGEIRESNCEPDYQDADGSTGRRVIGAQHLGGPKIIGGGS
jgi:hypothetical protein